MKIDFQNARGSALLNAIIVAGIVAGVAGIILTQTKTTDKMSRNPRIKSAMTVLETQMLSMAMQPGIYQGCSAQAQNCQLNSTAVEAFKNLNRKIVGAHCGSPYSQPGGSSGSATNSTSCGIKVQVPSSSACLNSQNPTANASCSAGQFYNPATQTFCAEIVYEGTDVAMQPMCASTTVPQSVLQGDATSCNSAANLAGPYPNVIFKGYDGAGNAVCSNIPSCSGGNLGTPGNYISSIDKQTIQTQCKNLGTGALTCPPGTVLSGLKWKDVTTAFGTISVTSNCTPRRVPADNHQVQAVTAITNPPTTYTVVTPTTVPPATPTTLPSTLLCGGTTYSAMCFVAGTPVAMANGSSKKIEDVQIGDLVKTFDESTGQMTVSPVIETLHHPVRVNSLYTLRLSSGKSVTSNDVHPFYLPDENIYATAPQILERLQLRLPVHLLDQKSHLIQVVSIEKSVAEVPLYNLHVLSPYDTPTSQSSVGHNYFAGGVLVHNLKVCADAMTNIDYMFTINCYQNGDGTYSVQAQCQFSGYTEGHKTDVACDAMLSSLTHACDQTITTNIGATSCTAYCGTPSCPNLGSCSHVIPPPWNGP